MSDAKHNAQPPPEIVARHGYVDTLVLHSRARPLPGELAAIRRRCRGDGTGKQAAWCKRHEGWAMSGGWLRWWTVVCQRPSTEAVQLLDQMARRHPDSRVSRCDYAVDLEAGTNARALALANGVRRRLDVPYSRGHRRRKRGQNTTYLKPDNPYAPGFALYADKPSKVNGRPCVHLELRLRRAKVCRRFGIVRPIDAISLVPELEVLEYVRLWGIDYAKLGRASHRAARRRFGPTLRRSFGRPFPRGGLPEAAAAKRGRAIVQSAKRPADGDADVPDVRDLRDYGNLRGFGEAYLVRLDPVDALRAGGPRW